MPLGAWILLVFLYASDRAAVALALLRHWYMRLCMFAMVIYTAVALGLLLCHWYMLLCNTTGTVVGLALLLRRYHQ